MHHLFVALLVIASPCLARPAQDQPTFNLWNPSGPVMGFPAALLPSQPANTSNNTSLFSVPLDPDVSRDIGRQLFFGPGTPPRGIELVASIASRIAAYWADTANSPIKWKIHDRGLPYKNFEFITQPTSQQGASLTPLKLGITSLWIIRRVLEVAKFPGKIRAEIWDTDPQDASKMTLKVGQLDITNRPLAQPVDNSDSASNSTLAPIDLTDFNRTGHSIPSSDGNAGAVGIPDDLERRWMNCWAALFFWTLRFAPSDKVVDHVVQPYSQDPYDRTVSMSCYNWGVRQQFKDQLEITLLRRPNPGSGHQLVTFGELVPALTVWIVQVASLDDAWRTQAYVRDDARMSVKLDGQSGGVTATS